MRPGLRCFVLLLSQLGFGNWQNWAIQAASCRSGGGGTRQAGSTGGGKGLGSVYLPAPALLRVSPAASGCSALSPHSAAASPRVPREP